MADFIDGPTSQDMQGRVFVFGAINAGTSDGVAKTVYIDGLKLPGKPASVVCQPRRVDETTNLDRTEVFTVQVISTSKEQIRLLVRRTDGGGNWGDQLRIDFMIVA